MKITRIKMFLYTKRIVITSLFLFTMVTTYDLYSALLFDIPYKIVQPDGTIVDVFSSGDEFYNWFHDKDGYSIVHDVKSGFWCWAKCENEIMISTGVPVHLNSAKDLGLNPRENISEHTYNEKRLHINNHRFHRNGGTPSTGIIQSILIFIRFAGESEFEQRNDYYHSIFNNNTLDEMSVFNFFYKESYGSLEFYTNFFPVSQGTRIISYEDIYDRNFFYPSIESPDGTIYNPDGYTGGEYGVERKQREHQLIKRALQYIADQIPPSLIIDSDNDGDIDHFNIIIREGKSLIWNQLLWPHQGIYDTEDFYIKGKRVQAYNFNLENFSSEGVLCHEIGHSLGMPDLYRHSLSIAPIGHWDLMSQNTALISVYMKYAYTNWLSSLKTKEERINEIPEITTSGIFSLYRALSNRTNNIYKINSPNTDDEFFIVEYTEGLHEGPFYSSGLLIYRVNTTLIGNAAGPPDELWVYRPSLGTLEDGLLHCANFTSSLNRTVINDFTDPASLLSDNRLGGLNIYDIGENNSEIIDFKVKIVSNKSENDIINKKKLFQLFQSYPNPFNPTTTIKFRIENSELRIVDCHASLAMTRTLSSGESRGEGLSLVKIEIINIKGQKIKTLVNGNYPSGEHSVIWNGTDDHNTPVTSGIYFYRLTTDNHTEIKKMILIK